MHAFGISLKIRVDAGSAFFLKVFSRSRALYVSGFLVWWL
ncbi:hypothetical protein AmDm5_1636 [Acetobacter malorum]|nr:hypothetical protein AmDm5_1636 [Acetobacter malorum]